MSSENLPPDLTVSLAPPAHPATAALRELEYRFAVYDDDPNVLTFGMAGDNGAFTVLCLNDSERELLCLHAVYPIRTHPTATTETLRFLNQLNRKLPGGGFRLDPEDGEITFRHTVHLGAEARLDLPTFRAALHLVRFALDDALPAITQVAHAHATAAEALTAATTPEPNSN